jgi:hypothetical protein
MTNERALAEFDRLAKELPKNIAIEPNTDHGITGYTIAKYWFMLGWQAQYEDMCNQYVHQDIQSTV